MTFDTSKRIAVVAGGISNERDISLRSGAGVLNALVEEGIDAELVDPATPQGIEKLLNGDYDVAFLCTHGKGGEDGTVQGLLELLKIPYTGSGVEASAVAMNKRLSKYVYRENGIPVADDISIRCGEPYGVSSILQRLGNKVVVKPTNDGSSFGVSIVEGTIDLEQAISNNAGNDVIVEQFIEGREITVSVIGNDDVIPLPVIEIIPNKGEFYDFESKYANGGSTHICPAQSLSDEETRIVQELAVRTHKALRCRGMSRTDMIIDDSGKIVVLETNTLPGMTETSLLPDAAAKNGLDYNHLCLKLLELALE